jgi:hypothetical protein
VEGLRVRAPLPAQVLGAEGETDEARVVAALVTGDAVLHTGERLEARGLDVPGVNPLRVLDVARDDAAMQVHT